MMPKSKPLPPVELINQVIAYDLETGAMSWKIKTGHVTPGKQIQCVGPGGYYRVTLEGRKLAAHRVAWLIATGEDPASNQIDHVDGNKLNNAFLNLRIATHAQNQWNKGKGKNNRSGYKGVSWSKLRMKWAANIYHNKKRIFLGYFSIPELAHMAYCKVAAELRGEFARAS